ncbi:MAG TPA: hypothetical protein VFH78_09480 [Candidatus Thermoplasmatota archaeon]|nr:hypothetical protein [Candidatus Thermoplasmatota archaeon]
MEWPTLETFAYRPRDALMWVPRALDLARIRAALDVAGPRRVDVGAGTGLLAALLHADVEPVEPHPPRVRYAELLPEARPPYDAALLSWMEAGKDYRADVARLAPVVLQAYDVEGGCGVKGDVSFAPLGYVEAASWRTPSFEDVAYALEHRGALRRKAYPGNRIDVLARDPALVAPLRAAVEGAQAGEPLPWEGALARLRL